MIRVGAFVLNKNLNDFGIVIGKIQKDDRISVRDKTGKLRKWAFVNLKRCKKPEDWPDDLKIKNMVSPFWDDDVGLLARNWKPIEPGMFVRNINSLSEAMIITIQSQSRIRVRRENGVNGVWLQKHCVIIDKPDEWAAKFKVRLKRPERAAFILERKNKVIKLTEEGKTAKEIAKQCGVHHSLVYKVLKKAGVSPNPPPVTKKKRQKGSGTRRKTSPVSVDPETERMLRDPNKVWNGRYCQKCGEKIFGANFRLCKSCNKKRINSLKQSDFSMICEW